MPFVVFNVKFFGWMRMSGHDFILVMWPESAWHRAPRMPQPITNPLYAKHSITSIGIDAFVGHEAPFLLILTFSVDTAKPAPKGRNPGW